MHTIKITPNLLFEHQCTSGKFIRLPNRIESNRNFFGPNWNALVSTPFITVLAFQNPDIPLDPEDIGSPCPQLNTVRNMFVNRCLFQYI